MGHPSENTCSFPTFPKCKSILYIFLQKFFITAISKDIFLLLIHAHFYKSSLWGTFTQVLHRQHFRDLVLPICHVKARPRKRGDVTIPSVVKLKAKCCKLPTSYCVLQDSVLCIFTNWRTVAISQSKIPMSKKSAGDKRSAYRHSKTTLFFPISSSGGRGEDATQEGQVKSHWHKLCQISRHSYLWLGPTMKQPKH